MDALKRYPLFLLRKGKHILCLKTLSTIITAKLFLLVKELHQYSKLLPNVKTCNLFEDDTFKRFFVTKTWRGTKSTLKQKR